MNTYLTNFHTARKAGTGPRPVLSRQPIRNGSKPAATALLKLPSATASHAMPKR